MTGPADRLPDDAIPRLPRGVRLRHDEARETCMLLAPERAVKLDPIAQAVLERVDGETSFGGIVDALAEAYSAPRDQIAGDVRAMLIDLMDKRMLEVAS